MSRLSHSEIHMVHRIGWLRAAVLGANDGLVSTASLVVGVAAAGSGKPEVFIAGLAGLVAGAMSMAAGEYVSVSSQADAEQADIERETRELKETPDAELLPLHVHFSLGLGTFMVGLVAGSQFLASILTRVFAGNGADRWGPKRAVMAGLIGAIVSGALSLASLVFTARPLISVSVLLAGRAMLGAAESFIITGAAAWGLALVGRQHAGRVIAWVGMAMFASMALGAPLGMTLYGLGGFALVAAAITLIPLLTLLLVLPMRPAATAPGAHPGLLQVARAVWLPGVGSALSSLGYNGRDSRWYTSAMRERAGRIMAVGIISDVHFDPVDGVINGRIDDAYRAKYRGSPYLNAMIGQRAREATVRIAPRNRS